MLSQKWLPNGRVSRRRYSAHITAYSHAERLDGKPIALIRLGLWAKFGGLSRIVNSGLATGTCTSPEHNCLGASMQPWQTHRGTSTNEAPSRAKDRVWAGFASNLLKNRSHSSFGKSNFPRGWSWWPVIGDGEAPSIVPWGATSGKDDSGTPHPCLVYSRHSRIPWMDLGLGLCISMFLPEYYTRRAIVHSSPCGENGAGKIGIFLFSNQPSFLWSHILPLCSLCMIFISKNLKCQKSSRLEDSKNPRSHWLVGSPPPSAELFRNGGAKVKIQLSLLKLYQREIIAIRAWFWFGIHHASL